MKGAWLFLVSGLATVAFALAWTAAVLLKLLAAGLTAAVLRHSFGEQVPALVKFPVNGLLTGVTECGVTLAVVALTPLRGASWASVVAFGIAFGAFEAVVLAASLILGGLAGLLPDAFPTDHPEELARNLANPLRPFIAWERVVVIPVHALSCVLVVLAFRQHSAAPFWAAFALKSAIYSLAGPDDGALPPLVVEAVYGAFGLISLFALGRLGW